MANAVIGEFSFPVDSGIVRVIVGVVVLAVTVQVVQSLQEVHSLLHSLASHVLLLQPGQVDPGHFSSGQHPESQAPPHGPPNPVGHDPVAVQVCVASW